MTSTDFSVGFNNNKPSSRVLQAPGGGSSSIADVMFGSAPINGSNGIHGRTGDFSSSSSDAGTPSCPSTPVPSNGTNGTNGYIGPSDGSDSSAPSSASSSRRGSRQEDTKNRLFGAEQDSPRRRVVDRMKSNIFSENQVVNHARPTPRKYEHVIRRNPITGEVYADETDRVNGHGINGKSNGFLNGNGSASLPATPVRVRQPPGGKSSGIF